MGKNKRKHSTDSLATPGDMRVIWKFIESQSGYIGHCLRVYQQYYPGIWCIYVKDIDTANTISHIIHPSMYVGIYVHNNTSNNMYTLHGTYGKFIGKILPTNVFKIIDEKNKF